MSALPLAIESDPRDPVALLDDPVRTAAVAAKAYARVVQAWSLDNQAAAALIDVGTRTWARIKQGGWSGRFSQDQLMRIGALIGLYKALHLYFSDALADDWVRLPNRGPLFGGEAPLAFMRAGGLPAVIETRNYVDALRGGV